MRTRSKVQSATATLTSGTGDYTLDTDIIEVIDVYVTASGSSYKLQRVDLDQILNMWLGSSASVSPVQYFATAGGNMLSVYPTPSSSSDKLMFYFVARPTALSVSSDAPSDVPAEWHPAIEFYTLSRAADYDDDQSSAQGERYRQRYEQELTKIRRQLALKGHHRLPRATVGSNRTWPAHDHSRYP